MYTLTCFKKLFTSPMFWVSVIGTAAICMFSELYHDWESESVKTVIEVYLQYPRNVMLSDTTFCSYSVFVNSFSKWLAMFVPVIAALASVSICMDERKSGMWRSVLHRVGRVRYSMGGCMFILFSGGLVSALGYGLFGILAAIMFPPLSAFPPESAEFFTEITFQKGSAMYSIYQTGGFSLCAAAQLAQTFFYGMVCSAAAMLFSTISENKYVIICTPFFLKYALVQFSETLGIKAIKDPLGVNEKLLRFSNIINPNSAKSFLNYTEGSLITFIINAAFTVILSILFCVIRIRRLKNET